MAREATVKALLDIRKTYDVIEQAYVEYCFGDSTCEQRAVYQLVMTQIPIINVNNNCSTGSTALYLARQAIEFGIVDCALALDFEKMSKGSLAANFNDHTSPLDTTISNLSETPNSPFMAQVFGNAGIEYCEKYGANAEHMAKIGEKIIVIDVYSLEQIKSSPQVFGPLTKLQCCPTSDGSAAVIYELATVSPNLLELRSSIELAGADMTRKAAK
ncbi:thiolase-like protein [Glomus cerebriforme]|uniref:Thiolase-like protein n=1 Tax=Glomus cerebriforme TaxID=658196 RepID=A0A397RZ28_9GLOM|nr:thiolase-like protein [Glomus cerebriforme]